MAVDIFTKAQFESALPVHKQTGEPLWRCDGLRDGEYEYLMPIDSLSAILIRSSIHSDGFSAESGEDSIRAWLVNNEDKPLGSKVSKRVTRVPGWETRLKETLRTLWQWRKTAGNCPHCNQPLKIFKVKKPGPNKGRVFAKCEHHNGWVWLDEVAK